MKPNQDLSLYSQAPKEKSSPYSLYLLFGPLDNLSTARRSWTRASGFTTDELGERGGIVTDTQ